MVPYLAVGERAMAIQQYFSLHAPVKILQWRRQPLALVVSLPDRKRSIYFSQNNLRAKCYMFLPITEYGIAKRLAPPDRVRFTLPAHT